MADRDDESLGELHSGDEEELNINGLHAELEEDEALLDLHGDEYLGLDEPLGVGYHDDIDGAGGWADVGDMADLDGASVGHDINHEAKFLDEHFDPELHSGTDLGSNLHSLPASLPPATPPDPSQLGLEPPIAHSSSKEPAGTEIEEPQASGAGEASVQAEGAPAPGSNHVERMGQSSRQASATPSRADGTSAAGYSDNFDSEPAAGVSRQASATASQTRGGASTEAGYSDNFAAEPVAGMSRQASAIASQTQGGASTAAGYSDDFAAELAAGMSRQASAAGSRIGGGASTAAGYSDDFDTDPAAKAIQLTACASQPGHLPEDQGAQLHGDDSGILRLGGQARTASNGSARTGVFKQEDVLPSILAYDPPDDAETSSGSPRGYLGEVFILDRIVGLSSDAQPTQTAPAPTETKTASSSQPVKRAWKGQAAMSSVKTAKPSAHKAQELAVDIDDLLANLEHSTAPPPQDGRGQPASDRAKTQPKSLVDEIRETVGVMADEASKRQSHDRAKAKRTEDVRRSRSAFRERPSSLAGSDPPESKSASASPARRRGLSSGPLPEKEREKGWSTFTKRKPEPKLSPSKAVVTSPSKEEKRKRRRWAAEKVKLQREKAEKAAAKAKAAEEIAKRKKDLRDAEIKERIEAKAQARQAAKEAERKQRGAAQKGGLGREKPLYQRLEEKAARAAAHEEAEKLRKYEEELGAFRKLKTTAIISTAKEKRRTSTAGSLAEGGEAGEARPTSPDQGSLPDISPSLYSSNLAPGSMNSHPGHPAPRPSPRPSACSDQQLPQVRGAGPAPEAEEFLPEAEDPDAGLHSGGQAWDPGFDDAGDYLMEPPMFDYHEALPPIMETSESWTDTMKSSAGRPGGLGKTRDMATSFSGSLKDFPLTAGTAFAPRLTDVLAFNVAVGGPQRVPAPDFLADQMLTLQRLAAALPAVEPVEADTGEGVPLPQAGPPCRALDTAATALDAEVQTEEASGEGETCLGEHGAATQPVGADKATSVGGSLAPSDSSTGPAAEDEQTPSRHEGSSQQEPAGCSNVGEAPARDERPDETSDASTDQRPLSREEERERKLGVLRRRSSSRRASSTDVGGNSALRSHRVSSTGEAEVLSRRASNSDQPHTGIAALRQLSLSHRRSQVSEAGAVEQSVVSGPPPAVDPAKHATAVSNRSVKRTASSSRLPPAPKTSSRRSSLTSEKTLSGIKPPALRRQSSTASDKASPRPPRSLGHCRSSLTSAHSRAAGGDSSAGSQANGISVPAPGDELFVAAVADPQVALSEEVAVAEADNGADGHRVVTDVDSGPVPPEGSDQQDEACASSGRHEDNITEEAFCSLESSHVSETRASSLHECGAVAEAGELAQESARAGAVSSAPSEAEIEQPQPSECSLSVPSKAAESAGAISSDSEMLETVRQPIDSPVVLSEWEEALLLHGQDGGETHHQRAPVRLSKALSSADFNALGGSGPQANQEGDHTVLIASPLANQASSGTWQPGALAEKRDDASSVPSNDQGIAREPSLPKLAYPRGSELSADDFSAGQVSLGDEEAEVDILPNGNTSPAPNTDDGKDDYDDDGYEDDFDEYSSTATSSVRL